jgi:hypothetical protein
MLKLSGNGQGELKMSGSGNGNECKPLPRSWRCPAPGPRPSPRTLTWRAARPGVDLEQALRGPSGGGAGAAAVDRARQMRATFSIDELQKVPTSLSKSSGKATVSRGNLIP